MRPTRAEAPSRPFRVRLSPVERELVDRAAAVNRQNGADFARTAMLTAAAECLERPAPRRAGAPAVLTPRGIT